MLRTLVRDSIRGQPWAPSRSHSRRLVAWFSLKGRTNLAGCLSTPNLIATQCRLRPVQRRALSTSLLTTVLIPPAVFVGLIIVLWTWKCLMMVIFQDKIIYMPSVPPFSRQEIIKDYVKACQPVLWQEETIKSTDGTRLSLCIGSIPDAAQLLSKSPATRRVVLLYFQGNASSTPPRLPMLSNIFKDLAGNRDGPVCTVVALSYRGFWKSSGRASQAGIQRDATAALHQAFQIAKAQDADVLLWGQSIGAGIATDALMRHVRQHTVQTPRIVGLLLETPFSSIRNMLATLYPQKWLPYRYLWPFLWNWWDTEAAMKQLAASDRVPPVQIIAAGKDEVVPTSHGPQLGVLCHSLGLNCDVVVVPNAYHHETTTKSEGRRAIVKFVSTCKASD